MPAVGWAPAACVRPFYQGGAYWWKRVTLNEEAASRGMEARVKSGHRAILNM